MMNTRTTFMLMAATVVAPLYAQQPTESAADIFQTLAASQPAAVQATVEQKAAAFPALKAVPADADAFFCFTHVAEHVERLRQAGCLGALLEGEDNPLLRVEGLSVALGKGSSASLEAISPLLRLASSQDQVGTVTQIWASQAKENLSAVLSRVAADALAQQSQEATAQSPEVLVHPIYLTVTFKPTEPRVQDWGNSLTSSLQGFASRVDEVGEPVDPSGKPIESVDINGMSGIRIKGSVFSQGAETPTDKTPLGQELEKRTFYLLVKSDAASISVVLCERPDEIHFASIPEESVLATDKLASSALRPGMIAAAYANPELTRWNQSFSLQSFVDTANAIRSQFEHLGPVDPASKEAYDKAAAAVGMVAEQVEKFYRATPGVPSLMQLWTEGKSVVMESTSPLPEGVSYLPTRLRLTGLAKEADTILYFEGGSVQRKEALPSSSSILDGALDVARAVLLTLPEQKQDEYSAQWQMVNSFLPDAKSLSSALELMGSGLTGSSALVVDAGGSLPPALGGTPGNKIAIPRISVYSGISDRSRLAAAWQQVLAVAGNVAVKLGQDPAIVGMLPIMPTHAGDAMSYSVALPFFTEDMAPNVTINDTALALGSSPVLNSRVVASATGAVDFTGAVFSFHPAPLAASLRAIADSLAASLPEDDADCVEAPLDDEAEEENPYVVVDSGATQAEEAADETSSTEEEPAAESDDADGEEADGGDGDDEDDLDDEEEEEGVDIAEVELMPAEVAAMERAENAEDAAQAAEFLSRNVESVHGVVVPAGEGSQTLRIQVNLR